MTESQFWVLIHLKNIDVNNYVSLKMIFFKGNVNLNKIKNINNLKIYLCGGVL